MEWTSKEAIEAPRWLHGETGPQTTDSKLLLESRFGKDIAEALERMGHEVVVTGACGMIVWGTRKAFGSAMMSTLEPRIPEATDTPSGGNQAGA